MQAYKFTCPSCRETAKIHEITHCWGIQSEIHAFINEGNLGENTPLWGCHYVDGTGVGDVDNVTYECSECGTEIEVDSREALVELDCVELYDHPPTPENLPPGFFVSERGNNLLCRGSNIIGYYDCGNGPFEERTWLEVSVCPENYPVTNIRTFNQTPADLLAHCTKLVEDNGWEWIKNNLE